MRPRPFVAGAPRTHFVRGKAHPRGVVWFGVTSFWGHMQHFVASAIATEDVDSRDWMTPDEPPALLALVARTLGGDDTKPTLVAALGRDVWVDYVADTGDDVSVSRAVGKLVFAPYELPDPDRPGEHLVAPRGDALVFGGDTAYPVATAREIAMRVVAPWNDVLATLPPDRPRVLLGIPGNHDWYDGLDGFARMFRRPDGGDGGRPTEIEPDSPLLHAASWIRQFVLGGQVDKPRSLVLSGYRPVQSASYFALPLAQDLDLLAVDRQLREIDPRQRAFFRRWLDERPATAPWVLLPDPVHAFGEPSPTGTAMMAALGLEGDARPTLVLSGDTHHYERRRVGETLHVTAGGGGAFLHPAPTTSHGRPRPDVEFPGAEQSRALLRGVAAKIAVGRSGFLPHLLLVLAFLPAVGLGLRIHARFGVFVPAPIAAAVLTTIVYALLGDVRRRGRRVWGPALVAGVLTAAVPAAVSVALAKLAAHLHVTESLSFAIGSSLVVAAFAGTFVFGLYLAILTRLGLEHTQAFTALDHPGFKHFVRLRVRGDGSGVDAWCVGLVDPLAPDAEPVLVDAVTWRPRR